MPRHNSVTRNKWQAWIYTVAAKLMMSHFKWGGLVDNGVFGKWGKSLQGLSASPHSPILFTLEQLFLQGVGFLITSTGGKRRKIWMAEIQPSLTSPGWENHNFLSERDILLLKESFVAIHLCHEESMSKELYHEVRPDPAVLYAKSTWKGIKKALWDQRTHILLFFSPFSVLTNTLRVGANKIQDEVQFPARMVL